MAYVPTMDNVIDSPALLVQELVHAVTVAAARSKDPAVTSKLEALKVAVSQLPLQRKDAVFRDASDDVIDKAYSLAADVCRSIRDESGQRMVRLVLVIDQDNRLWKKIETHANYLSLDTLITTLQCQLILCASANNEGWKSRHWVIRVYHGIAGSARFGL